jgi:hypothetical protein
MARPTKYNKDILKQAEDYLENYEEYEHPLPTIEGLASVLGTHKDTIYDWESQEDKTEFSDVVKRIRNAKSIALQHGGLTNKFNAKISGLLLGHEGYRDSKDITTKGKELPQPIMEVTEDDN